MRLRSVQVVRPRPGGAPVLVAVVTGSLRKTGPRTWRSPAWHLDVPPQPGSTRVATLERSVGSSAVPARTATGVGAAPTRPPSPPDGMEVRTTRPN